jgi:hypothetical protein
MRGKRIGEQSYRAVRSSGSESNGFLFGRQAVAVGLAGVGGLAALQLEGGASWSLNAKRRCARNRRRWGAKRHPPRSAAFLVIPVNNSNKNLPRLRLVGVESLNVSLASGLKSRFREWSPVGAPKESVF